MIPNCLQHTWNSSLLRGKVVQAHVDDLIGQITRIIADGVASGEFTVSDPITAGQAVFYATTRFHNPVHASEWSDPDIDRSFEGVWSLILYGLGVRSDREDGFGGEP